MKIALAQINTTVGDFEGNVTKILHYARMAVERKADLVIFPEMAVCGYPPRDMVERPDFIEQSESELSRLSQLLPEIPALIGYVRASRVQQGKAVSNAAALVYRGKILLDYVKILLPFYDVFDESRYFEPGSALGIYDLQGMRIGVTICEDIWNDKNFWRKRLYTRDPVEEISRAGARLLLNIASSPYSIEKLKLRHDMLRTIATEHHIPVAYVNHVGGNDQLILDGSSLAFSAGGTLIARAKSFEEDLLVFDPAGTQADIHDGPASDIEAIYKALLLGTRDYMSKCGFKKAIVGLSGGIDSSVVVTLAADALGPDNVHAIAMPGPYSSRGSVTDAEELARRLGIDFRVIPITSIYGGYLQTLEPSFKGLAVDVTEENIQARVRGNILMALSNKLGAMVLSTGNKSELAVGYCTLYGDMAGGLSVIADLPKTMVYTLAGYLNREKERIPRSILEKPPSAELRANQTDQDTLPPYDVLDTILKSVIEDRLSTRDIAAKYKVDLALVKDVMERVMRAEYKRQQAAPALKVTAKAFGMGRRYPIAQKFIG
ncbi:MAG: NAD+ synthase [Acidobacteria bacterium]|nr:MAG: NAD+ synthase [Acidobacteriota bacterium]